jgi:hypothetical protein
MKLKNKKIVIKKMIRTKYNDANFEEGWSWKNIPIL